MLLFVSKASLGGLALWQSNLNVGSILASFGLAGGVLAGKWGWIQLRRQCLEASGVRHKRPGIEYLSHILTGTYYRVRGGPYYRVRGEPIIAYGAPIIAYGWAPNYAYGVYV